MRSVFASNMRMFRNEKFMKIDFYDMEPAENDDGQVIEQKGEVTRITVPVEVFDNFCKKYTKNRIARINEKQ